VGLKADFDPIQEGNFLASGGNRAVTPHPSNSSLYRPIKLHGKLANNGSCVFNLHDTVVTICTTCFNNKIIRIFLTVY
jgi:hypothetical protein